ncbi:hypothetical protein MPSEU_000903900 [Mayamaea pseudoterrestris]|nr:hypothetical protein MPSEU_000903900 [Mayamaea pseudoterrestris]
MPATRKRKSSSKKSTNTSPTKETDMFKGSVNKKKKAAAAGKEPSSSGLMFSELADADDPTVMGMEGISQLGEKLDMDVTEDVRILVLLWKLGSEDRPGEISQTEWIEGCANLNLDSWAKFKNIVPTLDTGFMDNIEFKDFFKFCFQFNRQGTHRTLDKDLVIALLKLTLKERVANSRLESFCQFLESTESYARVTLDQWVSFLDFSLECEDLSNYDESTSAWPVLIDEYVEYMEKQQHLKSNK